MTKIQPKISIVTPSVRKEGLDVVHNALLRQTFKDWEWLVCSKFDPNIKDATWIKDESEGGYWTLNRAYNNLFRHVKGDIIVSWQDWIYAPPDGLQKFVDALEDYPESIISGVGDQYERLDEHGRPEIKIWSDPRKGLKNGSFYECYPNDCEWNFAAFPTKAIFEIGGMDEKLDFLGYGGDQYQVGERWDRIGKKFYLDQDNESFTVRHDRSAHGGQEEWDKNHVLFNGEYLKRKQLLQEQAVWPYLDYLKLDTV